MIDKKFELDLTDKKATQSSHHLTLQHARRLFKICLTFIVLAILFFKNLRGIFTLYFIDDFKLSFIAGFPKIIIFRESL